MYSDMLYFTEVFRQLELYVCRSRMGGLTFTGNEDRDDETVDLVCETLSVDDDEGSSVVYARQ